MLVKPNHLKDLPSQSSRPLLVHHHDGVNLDVLFHALVRYSVFQAYASQLFYSVHRMSGACHLLTSPTIITHLAGIILICGVPVAARCEPHTFDKTRVCVCVK